MGWGGGTVDRLGRGRQRRLTASVVALGVLLVGYAVPARALILSCDKVDDARSVSYGQDATITITNYLDSPVRIYWINYQGNRVVYHTLEPSESYRQKTFFTHIWLATIQDGSCASLFQVDRQTDRFAVRAETVTPPPVSATLNGKAGAGLDTLAPGWSGGE